MQDVKIKELEEQVASLKVRIFDASEQAILFKANYEALVTKVCEIFSIEVTSLTSIEDFFDKLNELAEAKSEVVEE